MKITFRLSVLGLALVTLPLLMSPVTSFAGCSERQLDNAYDDGYEDGYDDAMAKCPCPPKSFMSGFYVGAGGGYEGFQIEQKPWEFDERFGRFNTHANGGNARMFGGYGYYNRNFYLGGEVFFGTSWAEGSNSLRTPGLQYYGDFSAGNSYGASLLPGYKVLDSTLAFARLGIVKTDFTVKDTAGGINSSSSNWTKGFNTGVGVELPLYKGISARLEYDYINYSTFNNNGINGSNNAPSDNRATVDLIYHINK